MTTGQPAPTDMQVGAPISGLVLAGGESRRMGRDKAALEIAGRSLLARAADELIAVVPDVHVSVRPGQRDESLRAKYSLIEDELTSCGPAAGILAAHSLHPDRAWLVVACDMPLLSRLLLQRLLDSRAPDHEATAWLSADKSGPEPLCAIYEPATLAAFLAHVREGGNPGPRAWLQGRDTVLLEQFSPALLASANTPEDFELLAGQLEAIEAVSRAKTND